MKAVADLMSLKVFFAAMGADTIEDGQGARVANGIPHFPAAAIATEQPDAAHMVKVLGDDGLRETRFLNQRVHRGGLFTLENLHQAEALRVRQRFERFRRFGETFRFQPALADAGIGVVHIRCPCFR